jgi:hypothetical protein
MNGVIVFLFWAFAVVGFVAIALIIVMIPLAVNHRRRVKKAAKERSIDEIYQTLTIGDLLAAPELEQPMREWLQRRASAWLQAQVKGPGKSEEPTLEPAQEKSHSNLQKTQNMSASEVSGNEEPKQRDIERELEDQKIATERDQDGEVRGAEGPGNLSIPPGSTTVARLVMRGVRKPNLSLEVGTGARHPCAPGQCLPMTIGNMALLHLPAC